MAKSKTFWVTRDEDDFHGDKLLVYVWKVRDNPQKDSNGVWELGKSGVYDFCYRGFKALTGITLKPGERKKFRLEEV